MVDYLKRGLPAFSIYGYEVQNKDDKEIADDVRKKILDFVKGAIQE